MYQIIYDFRNYKEIVIRRELIFDTSADNIKTYP